MGFFCNYILRFFTLTTLIVSLSSCVSADKVDYVKLGNEYAKDGLYREAADVYHKALKIDPNDVHAARNLGVVYVKLGLYNRATKYLEKSTKVLSKNYQSNYYLAESYRATNQFDKAIFYYKNALQIRPKDFPSLKALSWSYYKINYYKAALKTINAVDRSELNNPHAVIIKSRILMKQKKYAGAKKEIYKLIVKSNPAYKPYAKSVLGDIYLSSGHHKKAKGVFHEALKEKPYLAGALLGLGKVLNMEGESEKAKTMIERALKLRPSLTEGYLELAKSYEKLNQKKAIIYYKAFVKRSINDPEFSHMISHARKSIYRLSKPYNKATRISKRTENRNNRRNIRQRDAKQDQRRRVQSSRERTLRQ